MPCAQGTNTPLFSSQSIFCPAVSLATQSPTIPPCLLNLKSATCRSRCVCLGTMRCREPWRSMHQLRRLLDRMSHTPTEEEEAYNRRFSSKGFRQVRHPSSASLSSDLVLVHHMLVLGECFVATPRTPSDGDLYEDNCVVTYHSTNHCAPSVAREEMHPKSDHRSPLVLPPCREGHQHHIILPKALHRPYKPKRRRSRRRSTASHTPSSS